MSNLSTLLKNGDLPSKVAAVSQWAITHDAIIEERWERQHGYNTKFFARTSQVEIDVAELKTKVAIYATVGTLIGTIVGSVISATLVWAFTR